MSKERAVTQLEKKNIAAPSGHKIFGIAAHPKYLVLQHPGNIWYYGNPKIFGIAAP